MAQTYSPEWTIARHDVKTLRKMRKAILDAGSDGIVQHLYRNPVPHGRARQMFGTLLNTMHELDLIRRLEVNTAGRPRELIIATEYLKNELLLEDVARKLGDGVRVYRCPIEKSWG